MTGSPRSARRKPGPAILGRGKSAAARRAASPGCAAVRPPGCPRTAPFFQCSHSVILPMSSPLANTVPTLYFTSGIPKRIAALPIQREKFTRLDGYSPCFSAASLYLRALSATWKTTGFPARDRCLEQPERATGQGRDGREYFQGFKGIMRLRHRDCAYFTRFNMFDHRLHSSFLSTQSYHFRICSPLHSWITTPDLLHYLVKFIPSNHPPGN